MPLGFIFYQSVLGAGRGNAVVGAVWWSWKGGPNQAVDQFLPVK